MTWIMGETPPEPLVIGRCYAISGGLILRYHGPYTNTPDSLHTFAHPQFPVREGERASASFFRSSVLHAIRKSDWQMCATRIQDAMARGLNEDALAAALALAEALQGDVT